MQKYCSYVRVSTRGQQESGLGIEAQREIVANYVRNNPGRILAEYQEAESGRNNERPRLAECLSHARRARAQVLVAKLDRLSRDASFLLRLKAGQVPIIFCDMPVQNEFLVSIMACVAQNEATLISQRTSAALQALKARGVALGSARAGHWDGREQARSAGGQKGSEQSARARRQRLVEFLAEFGPTFAGLRREGLSDQAIAQRLNDDGFMQLNGNEWSRMAVRRAFAVLEQQQEVRS